MNTGDLFSQRVSLTTETLRSSTLYGLSHAWLELGLLPDTQLHFGTPSYTLAPLGAPGSFTVGCILVRLDTPTPCC